MKFDEYLKQKNIDSETFKVGDSLQYSEFQKLFDQVHPESFTQQKLFLINKIRRKYQLKEQIETKELAPKKLMRPKIKISKPKIN